MRYLILILVFFGSATAHAQFPGTDSLRSYNNKYITNNPATAFTNLRLNTLLRGMIDFIDTARAGTGGGGAIGVDTLWALNDSTIRYRKNGVFRNFIMRGVYDTRRKVDTMYKVNDTTIGFTVNHTARTIIIPGRVNFADSIYRKAAKDSIYYRIANIEYAIKDSSGITQLTGDVTAGTGSGSQAATIATNAVTNAKLAQAAALTVKGNPTNATANLQDIAAATDNQVLRRSGTTIGFGALNLASSDAVTSLLPVANGGTGTATPSLIAGTDISITGTWPNQTINAPGGSGNYIQNQNSVIQNAKASISGPFQIGTAEVTDARVKMLIRDNSTATGSFAAVELKTTTDGHDGNIEGAAIVKHDRDYSFTPGYGNTMQVYALGATEGTILGNNNFVGVDSPYAPITSDTPNGYIRFELGPLWPYSEKARLNNKGDFIVGWRTVAVVSSASQSNDTVTATTSAFNASDVGNHFVRWGDYENGGKQAVADRIIAYISPTQVKVETPRTITPQALQICDYKNLFNYDQGVVHKDTTGTEKVQIIASKDNIVVTSDSTRGITLHSHSGLNVLAPALNFQRSEGFPHLSTSVLSGDQLGYLNFKGYNGSAYVNGATIGAVAAEDGSVGAGTHLTFSTTALGGSSSTEHLRITPAGSIGIGTTNPDYKLDVRTSTLVGVNSENTAVQGYGGVFVATNGSGNNKGIYVSATGGSGNKGVEVNSAMTDADYAIHSIGDAKTFLNGKVGIGNTSPTARLHLPAGTATANTAPLKFTSGTNLTTPEAGAVEMDADSLYWTNNAGTRIALNRVGSGGSYTFTNGLTESGGTTKLGGTLTENTTINTGGFTTTWTGANDGETTLSVTNTGTTNASAILGTASGATSTGVTGSSDSYIGVFGNSTSNTGIQGQSSSGVGVIGVSSTGAGLRGQNNPASTNAIENVLTLLRTSSAGAGANGLGAAIQYELETATSGTSQIAGSVAFVWEDATNATRTSRYEVHAVNSGTSARKFAVKGNGQLVADTYGAGTITGTAATQPYFDASGNIIEGAIGNLTGGSIKTNIHVVNDADYTVAATDYFIIYSNITTARTLTLPSAASSANRMLIIKHGGQGATAITLSTSIRENASTTTSSISQNLSYGLISDGTDWWIAWSN